MTLQGSCPPGSDSGSRFSASWHMVSRIATAEEEDAWSWHIGSSVPGAGSDTNMRDYEVYSSFPGSGEESDMRDTKNVYQCCFYVSQRVELDEVKFGE